jgi:hypothetical protein
MHDEVKVLHCCKNKKLLILWMNSIIAFYDSVHTYLSVRFIYTNIDLINTWPVVFVLDVGNTTQYNPSMKNTYAQKSIIQLHVKRGEKVIQKFSLGTKVLLYKRFTCQSRMLVHVLSR